ncbi:PRD domain-containing protein [Xylocopilactobacillus apis]|uniref:Transcription antiterminator BglG n=1 Tax=Xylocopilactobacillus apis TaxID=2932183 RepID=A0AAU9CS78_9LACO|nr:PRD domain-containing protein [Xylocopilactobacillus apis]BDR56827.1 transcription antiterminator BglG [Xylocopilactobacillus apis]
MFKITKVLNVNVVMVKENDQEFIVFGKGIGYHQKVNNLISPEQISKKFISIDDSRKKEMIESLNKIPPVYIDVTAKIVDYAEKKLDETLISSVYYSLTDHLYFAVARYNTKQVLGNRIYWEVKTYYPEMFEIGNYGLSVVKELLKIELPREEAANIAFHIINNTSKSSVKTNVIEATQLVDNMLQILRVLTKGSLNDNGLNYERFITHLKFFAERYLSNKMLSDDNNLLKMAYELYPDASKMALKIQKTVETIYDRKITNEEIAYLIIHIHRVLTH